MRINHALLAFSRTVHVYLTMLGLLVMLLFGITGFTVNHEDWFGATTPRVSDTEALTPLDLIAQRDNLRLVEHLRQSHGLRGAMADFDDSGAQFAIAFKEPGQIWEITIEKATGKTTVHHETFNFTATINNLHRGRYAGPAWSWIIDLSALLIVLACATGFVLWLALPRRRQWGVAMLVLGTLGTMAVIYFFVPGPDAKRPAPAAVAKPQTR